jgi:hypothetical protein
MMKNNATFSQIEPALYIDTEKIPSTAIGENFTYLGKIFDFEKRNNAAKIKIADKLNVLLEITSNLKIKAQLKLKILKSYIYTQLSFDLKIYDFGTTWVEQNLDSICIRHIRKWLDMPISSCISEMSVLPKHMTGLDLPTLSMVYEKFSLSKRSSMKNSSDSNIYFIWQETKNKNIRMDALLIDTPLKSTSVQLHDSQMLKASTHFYGLQSQGFSAQTVAASIKKSKIVAWCNCIGSLSETLHNFARKALQQQLPTASNLCKWKRITDPNCTLCKQGVPQTNKHVLSHCSAPIALERYTTRHNHILKLLADWIMREISDHQKLYADIPGDYNPIDEIFEPAVRPDIALVDGSKIVILELTVCHESNLEKSKLFKIEKYSKIREHLKMKYKTFSTKLFTIEISVLGFISDLTEFIKFAKLSKMRKDTIDSLIFQAIKDSFNINQSRHFERAS